MISVVYRNSFGFAVEEVAKPERFVQIPLFFTYSLFSYRNLPLGLVIGLGITSICYFLVNLSFFSVLSYDEMIGTQAVALVSPTTGVLHIIPFTHMHCVVAIWRSCDG